MAIRLELPPVLFPRLRVGWHTARTHFQRYGQHVSAYLQRAIHAPAAWRRFVGARIASRWSLRQRSLERQMRELAAFEEKYEALVDLLCWSAKDGVHSEGCARFADLRGWMCSNYRTVRARLRPFWVEPNGPESADPFESLFATENVGDVIHAPTGIEDLMLTRNALDAYRRSLEAQTRGN